MALRNDDEEKERQIRNKVNSLLDEAKDLIEGISLPNHLILSTEKANLRNFRKFLQEIVENDKTLDVVKKKTLTVKKKTLTAAINHIALAEALQDPEIAKKLIKNYAEEYSGQDFGLILDARRSGFEKKNLIAAMLESEGLKLKFEPKDQMRLIYMYIDNDKETFQEDWEQVKNFMKNSLSGLLSNGQAKQYLDRKEKEPGQAEKVKAIRGASEVLIREEREAIIKGEIKKQKMNMNQPKPKQGLFDNKNIDELEQAKKDLADPNVTMEEKLKIIGRHRKDPEFSDLTKLDALLKNSGMTFLKLLDSDQGKDFKKTYLNSTEIRNLYYTAVQKQKDTAKVDDNLNPTNLNPTNLKPK